LIGIGGVCLEEGDISKLVIVALGVPLVLGQQGIDLIGDLRARLENIIGLKKNTQVSQCEINCQSSDIPIDLPNMSFLFLL